MLDTTMDSGVSISIDRLYDRLIRIGLQKKVVQKMLLPDWWCKEFEEREGAVFEAAAYIARRTGLAFSDLINEDRDLCLSSDLGLCFKKRQGTDDRDLAIASGMAEQVAKVVAFACARDSWSVAGWDAEAVRREILSKHQWVDLDGLLDFCWNHGLPVVHLTNLPSGNGLKKFDGVAGVFEGRSVIATGINHKFSARMAFIVAHELGHIVSGHIQEGECLVDEKIIPDGDSDQQEQEADQFAVELIYGNSSPYYSQMGFVSPVKLARYASSQGSIDQVNPAAILLNFAWHIPKFWGLANKAIKELENEKSTAIQIINDRLVDGLDWDALSDDSCDFLERMVGLE